MRNVKLVIEYDGTNYFGFQKQKRHLSIQEELEKALTKLCNEKIKVISSGRTDSGVHAKAQVVNFKTTSNLRLLNIVKGLNSLLPNDIAATSARFVSLDFHSRFSAIGKIYRYQVWNSPIPSPLRRRFTYRYMFPLNFIKMRKGAKILIGKHDFKALTAKNRDKNNTIRTIKRIVISKRGKLITLTIEGDGFLYNMVRNIVGTLLLVGRGKLAVSYVRNILQSRDRAKAGPTAPPHGLTLIKVLY